MTEREPMDGPAFAPFSMAEMREVMGGDDPILESVRKILNAALSNGLSRAEVKDVLGELDRRHDGTITADVLVAALTDRIERKVGP